MAEREAPVEKKKKSGSETHARKILLPVRLTPEEHAEIIAKAEAAGVSAGGFLRTCALNRVTPGTKRRAPVDQVILEKAITELRRVGNNINQIARAANMNEPTDSVRLNHALNEYAATLQLLREAAEPVIIKGNIRTDGKALGNYLLSEGRYEKNREKNEHIEIWEARGLEPGGTLQNILADYERSAKGSQCEKPLFHAYPRLDDGETLTREQWLECINRLEERLELTGHERVIVTHRLNGQDHVHVAWNRMNPETGIAAPLHFYKHKCTDVAHELEREFGLRELSNDRKQGKLSHDEERQALRHGKSPQEIKEELRTCWQLADNGKSFAAVLDDCGYALAKGDRRDFVIVGSEGDIYDVARVTGSRVAEVRHRLADLDRENLPGVEEAKQIQLDRATTRDALKWEDDLANAAIEKAGREEREARQLREDLQEKQRAGHLGATLYDRADMVSMQRDAMRHLKDAHRLQQEQAAQEQQEKPEAQQPEQDVSDIRRDFWKELKSLKSDQKEQAHEDKKTRTEQTDYQQRKAERDAMRENSDIRQGRPAQSNEEEGKERERERE